MACIFTGHVSQMKMTFAEHHAGSQKEVPAFGMALNLNHEDYVI